MTFAPESYSSAMQQYGSKFAHDFFGRFASDLPQAFAQLKFYQPTKQQPDDVFAVYDADKIAFAVQLDPNLEHIIIWDGTEHVELCTAYADPPAMAIEYIRDDLLAQSAG